MVNVILLDLKKLFPVMLNHFLCYFREVLTPRRAILGALPPIQKCKCKKH